MSLRAVPSKLPAYLFSKKPVIACVEQNSDVHRILTDGECGWVVPPNNPMQLAKKMMEVFELSKSRLNEMGIAGYIYAQNNLVKNINLQNLVDIIISAR